MIAAIPPAAGASTGSEASITVNGHAAKSIQLPDSQEVVGR
jgi:hypothetical protein